MLFLRNTAEIFVVFQASFQKDEPLIHIVYSECVNLMKKLLSHFVRHEVYASLSGSELKRLDVGAATGLKKATEIGLDTEREMKAWNPQEKKAFRTAAQAFYIVTAKHLIKQLPLDKLLLHLRFLDPSSHLAME